MENRDHLFQPGVSGNPAGRPPGSKNKMKKMLEEAGPELMEVAINAAKAGDVGMMQILLGKFKTVDIRVNTGIVASAEPLTVLNETTQLALDGDIDTGLLQSVTSAVNTRIMAIDAQALDTRLKLLELAKLKEK